MSNGSKWFRLLVLSAVLAALFSACGADGDDEDGVFRVAAIMPSTISDLAFSQSMYDALVKIQEDMGGPEKMELVYSEGMFVVDDAAAAIRDYASEGYDLVIAHGSQYGSSLQEIAPDRPDDTTGLTVVAFLVLLLLIWLRGKIRRRVRGETVVELEAR